MGSTKINTSYNVRPDKHSSESIDKLNAEESVIIYDTTTSEPKYYDGSKWVSWSGENANNFIDLANTDVKNIDSKTYDIATDDNISLLNILSNEDWVINLPNIINVVDNFQISIIYKGDLSGQITTYNQDLIDGGYVVDVFEKGLIHIKKLQLSEGVYQWFVFNQVSYNSVPNQGKTRRLDFTNQSSIQLQHNLGFIPIVQLWIEDGGGGYVEANVDIDHNWETMNSLNIDFGNPQTGKLIY